MYYAGRPSELEENFTKPLSKVIAQTELFMLPGNHEMYSGGYNFLKYLDGKKSGGFRFIALDSDGQAHGRLTPELRLWAEEMRREGRKQQKINILLTSNHPYSWDQEGAGLWVF